MPQGIIKNTFPMNKVYVVRASSGCWDDYHWWIEGIFSTEEKACQHKKFVDDLIEKIRKEEKPYTELDLDEDEKRKLYKWESRQLEAKEFNDCDIQEIRIDTPTDYSVLNNELFK